MNNRQIDPIIYLIIILNVAVFALPYSGVVSYDTLIDSYAKINSEIERGQWYRLITATFLHAGFLHIFLNMYSLFAVGPAVVQIFRRSGFIATYFLTGITGSLLSFWLSNSVSIGASGAVFGLVGALLSFAIISRNRVVIQEFAMIIVINFAFGIFANGYIDNWAHLGGLLGGLVIGLLLPKNDVRFAN